MSTVQSMATSAAEQFFEGFAADGPDRDTLLVVQTFTPDGGWVQCSRPYQELTPALVQQLDRDRVTKVHVNAYNHTADFTITPCGPISPAYLT